MRFALLAAALALTACEKAPVAVPAAAPAPPASIETPAPVPLVHEGWQTTHPLVGKTAPDFSLQKIGAGAVTRDELGGRWTILGFWNPTLPGIEDEARYLRALNSAVDQDPDLDLLTIYLKPDTAGTDVARWFASNGGAPWPTLLGAGNTGDLFNVTTQPAYLLIGPDLTIHASRGPLSTDPDGIKPAIRGIAEIRKAASR